MNLPTKSLYGRTQYPIKTKEDWKTFLKTHPLVRGERILVQSEGGIIEKIAIVDNAKNIDNEYEFKTLNISNINTRLENIEENYVDSTELQLEVSEQLQNAKESGDFDGEDAIRVQIESSNGTIFRQGNISTILSCHVFRGSKEITNTLPNGCFTWQRVKSDGTVDESWIATPYGNHISTIQISALDVNNKNVFRCLVDI